MFVYRTLTNIVQKKSGRASSRFVTITYDTHDTTAAATLMFQLSNYAWDVRPRRSTSAVPATHLIKMWRLHLYWKGTQVQFVLLILPFLVHTTTAAATTTTTITYYYCCCCYYYNYYYNNNNCNYNYNLWRFIGYQLDYRPSQRWLAGSLIGSL